MSDAAIDSFGIARAAIQQSFADIHTVDADVLPSDVTDLGDWNDELDFESILQALGVEYSTDSVAQGKLKIQNSQYKM